MQYKNKIISFDFDGTLCENSYPNIGEPKKDMIKLIKRLKEKGYYIILNSCRRDIEFEEVNEFCKTNKIPIDHISLGIKSIADLYIDDRGLFQDTDTLENFIDAYFMGLREYTKNLTSGQLHSWFMENVANVPENPDYTPVNDENFKIYIPITGGMDSLTVWQMVKESGMPYELIYIDSGQDYAQLEKETITKLTGEKFQTINLEIDYKKYDYILLGRNVLIILKIAEIMKKEGHWGEIWFGNLAGESPIYGGDKSRRFFNDINKLLVLLNFDIRVVSPLIGWDKTDEVAYWLSRDIAILKNSKSCFDAKYQQCGKCQTCFRKYTAFKFHGIDIRDSFQDKNIMENFQPYFKKYKEKMGKALKENDYSHYSPSRINSTLGVIKILENTE